MSSEFFLIDCNFINDWSEGDLIEEIGTTNHVSVAVAMLFFGISHLDTGLSLSIDNDEIDRVNTLFNKYCSTFKFIVESDDNKKVFEK